MTIFLLGYASRCHKFICLFFLIATTILSRVKWVTTFNSTAYCCGFLFYFQRYCLILAMIRIGEGVGFYGGSGSSEDL